MKKISILLLLAFTALFYQAQTYSTGTVNLSSTAGLAMTVKVDVSTSVTLTLTGPSTRWFAVGFNAASMAAGTDVAAVHAAGALSNFDTYITGYAAPATDAQQNWTITSDQVNAGVRTVVATRALNTGDPNDYVFTAAPGTISFIWARSNTNSFSYAYHGNTNRGIVVGTLALIPVTPPPTGAANQSFCSGSTLQQIQVVGNAIQWYASPTGGNPLPANTVLVNGTTYYASQTVGGLESQSRLAVTVNLISAPTAQPVFINTPNTVCSNQNAITYNVNPIANASSYNWNNQVATGSTIQPSISYPIMPGMNSMNVTVSASNQCGQGPSSTITVIINPAYVQQVSASACDSFVWNGQILTNSGTYSYQGTTQNGCDSILTLQLILLNNTATNVNIAQCSPLTLNGQIFSQSGSYQQIIPTALGCDSIINIQFTLLPSDTVLIPVAVCDTFLLNGQVFTSSGIVPQLLSNANGCDSLVLWDIQINNSSITAIDTTVASVYLWNGQSYTQSGIYTQTFTAANGCDSTVILTLTLQSNQLNELDFRQIYPNPVCSGTLINVPYGKWKCYNINGLLLYDMPEEGTSFFFNWASGIYLLENKGSIYRIQVIE